MAEQALYRKYRSSDFSQVIGQDHVVRTLTSALERGHLSHAYLFTGPKGVGKTSVARLLARALNCTGSPKPCNNCANCKAAINSSLDVIEIDAASNRSIDSVRDLREKISLAPTQGKYKVYIIDEVHMLTTEAFNALLKTLEEPPAHAVFILATTEAHKLPETIISRTQRFSFKPITVSDMVPHLREIAESENITVDPEALELIAETAHGGFRDAISLLDQLASGGVSPLTVQTVRDVMGYSGIEEVSAIADALAEGNARTALEVATRLEKQGAQAVQVATQLTELWRNVMLTSTGATTPTDETVRKLAATVAPARSAHIVEVLLEVTRSHWPQLSLEAALVKLSTPETPLSFSSFSATPPTQTTAATAKTPDAPRTATPAPSAVATSTASQDHGISQPVNQAKPTLKPELWPKVLVLIKSQNNSLYALLQMYPVDFGDGEVTIKPRFNFHRDLFDKQTNRIAIEAAAAKVYGKPVKVNARTEEGPVRDKRPKPDTASELVSSALEILGGEIVE